MGEQGEEEGQGEVWRDHGVSRLQQLAAIDIAITLTSMSDLASPPPARSDLVLNLLSGSAGGACQVLVGQPLDTSLSLPPSPFPYPFSLTHLRPNRSQSRPELKRPLKASSKDLGTSPSRRSETRVSWGFTKEWVSEPLSE